MISRRFFVLFTALVGWTSHSLCSPFPEPVEADFLAPEFTFGTGQKISSLRLHYRTIGKPGRNARGVVTNAVLLLHGTTGSGAGFAGDDFGGVLFPPGGLLDASKYFIIMPDSIGHGKSAKPSDGLKAKFPRYGYRDMVRAQHLLLTDGLKVEHLRLIVGTSMGGMHTWLWAGMHPGFMDAAMPRGSLPERISGRNRLWRKMIIDSIKTDPEWMNGEYTAQPPGLRGAAELLYFMSSSPTLRRSEAPDIETADRLLEEHVAQSFKRLDANDVLYALDACHDYEPETGLDKIEAALSAVNFADDLINPPELGALEQGVARVKRGMAVVIPADARTRGHGTIMLARVWERQLQDLLVRSSAGETKAVR